MGAEDGTATSSADSLVENTLAIILESLEQLLSSPKTRELRAKANSFGRVLDRWATTPPTDDQRAALRELVLDLHAEAMALEKRHKSYRSIRVGAAQSGTHATSEGTPQEKLKGARGR